MSALISVVVPVYNVEKYLKKCIESIINQSYKNIQIVCIDDGSTDSSGAILDELASSEPRMKVVHQKNMGLMGVRTRGIAEATGEYIAFVDGDDYITLDMMETLLDTATKNGAEISVCGFELADESGKRLFVIAPQNKVISQTETLKELIYKDYKDSALYPLWNKLFAKKLFKDFKPSAKIANLGEDQYMNLVLINAAQKVAFSDKICYSYVQRDTSFMKVPKLSHIDDFFGLWSEKKEFIRNLNLLSSNRREVFNAYFTSMFDFYGFCYLTDKKTLTPRFNELLEADEYFKLKNLPKEPKNILRYLRFLFKRYF